jgi:pyridinium-3,5-bisthiocarboxylic acid mononucleotide nickel chelatase
MLRVEKDELEREWINVKVGAQDVRVKLGVRNKKVVSVAPEYEDALVAGRAEGIPLREVYEKAVSAAATKLGKRY